MQKSDSMKENPSQLIQYLESLADTKYRDFSAHLLPSGTNLLGVRLPLLRTLAKEIAKGDWKAFLSAEAESDYMEETMIRGFVRAYAKMDFEERLQQIATFVPLIQNWSVCDSFCATLRFRKNELPPLRRFLDNYLLSEEEYKARFGFVMLLDHFVAEEWLHDIFTTCDKCRTTAYYTQMAVAWLLSSCYIHFPDDTFTYLQKNRLTDFTHNMALRKICDSFRVTEQQKSEIRSLKRI